MASFTRHYKDKKLIEISMDSMEELIRNQQNKSIIADYVYERLYTRFLKIFDYKGTSSAEYDKHGEIQVRNTFDEEFKNGFVQLAACSLLIETFAAFLTGENQTPRGKSTNRFKMVFTYAELKNNPIGEFKANNQFYERIRCGLLHQGETKGAYKITRRGIKLIEGDKIDAFLFHKHLKQLLLDYKQDLNDADWDSEMWDCCRQKVRHIFNNLK